VTVRLVIGANCGYADIASSDAESDLSVVMVTVTWHSPEV